MKHHPPLASSTSTPRPLPTLKFAPAVHIITPRRCCLCADGLPKLKDFPAEFGGSGDVIAE